LRLFAAFEQQIQRLSPTMMFAMSDSQFGLVYNVLSFSLASMMATTIFLWMRMPGVKDCYQSALIISGLVTFIAAYHYIRIFNSWVEAYEYKPNSSGQVENPTLTGVPFNDAYRYMDWLLTVPLLLIEIVFVMKLSEEETKKKATYLGVASGLMICNGYPGELIVEGDLSVRWFFWAFSLCPFTYVVYELLVGMAASTNSESDPTVKSLIQRAQYWTVISWLTYPVVYVFPMIGFSGSHAIVAVQVGYCMSDIISKCGVGIVIYCVTDAKSKSGKEGALLG
jgi:bacteriorhodopsin